MMNRLDGEHPPDQHKIVMRRQQRRDDFSDIGDGRHRNGLTSVMMTRVIAP